MRTINFFGERYGIAKRQGSRGRAQDRSKVAGGQDHEVRYASEKTGAPKAAVKSAVKRVGNSRKAVEKAARK